MREVSNDIETRAAVLTDAADLINSALKLFEGLEERAMKRRSSSSSYAAGFPTRPTTTSCLR